VTSPSVLRHEADYQVERLRELKARAPLLASPLFRGFVEAKKVWRDLARQMLHGKRLDDYDQGRWQGILEVLDDLCLDEDGLARKCQEVEGLLQGLQSRIQDTENRSWRAEPPRMAPARPPQPMRRPDLELSRLSP